MAWWHSSKTSSETSLRLYLPFIISDSTVWGVAHIILDSFQRLIRSVGLMAPVMDVQGAIKNSWKLSSCCIVSGLLGARIKTFDFLYFCSRSAATSAAITVLPRAVGATIIELPFLRTFAAIFCWYNRASIFSGFMRGCWIYFTMDFSMMNPFI